MPRELIFIHHDLETGEVSLENGTDGCLSTIGALSPEEGKRFGRALRRAIKRADPEKGASFWAAHEAAPPLKLTPRQVK